MVDYLLQPFNFTTRMGLLSIDSSKFNILYPSMTKTDFYFQLLYF